jgi:hypothetical protein
MIFSLVLAAVLGQTVVPFAEFPKSATDIKLIYDTQVYQSPVILGGDLNTHGWEDSPEVSWDGRSVVFMYSPLDIGLFGQSQRIRTAPPRREFPMLNSNARYRSDIMRAVLRPDGLLWDVVAYPTAINTSAGMEGCAHLATDGRSLLFSRSWEVKGAPRRALFWSKKFLGTNTWQGSVPLSSQVNDHTTYATADNPFLTPTKLYFEKKTPGAGGSFDIYSIDWPLKATSKAVPFTAINSADFETQIWISPDLQEYWFCRNHIQICRYKPGGRVEPVVFALAGALGEPSLDKDGNLYFVYVFTKLDPALNLTVYDSDIVVLKRK